VHIVRYCFVLRKLPEGIPAEIIGKTAPIL
jgi:hypothetical protein